MDALGDVSERVVVEIGPGRGALTSLLAQRAGYLIAIELDRVLGAQLRMKYANRTNLEIVEGDVLDIDLSRLMRRERRTSGDIHPGATEKAAVVGNLPYYITSPNTSTMRSAAASSARKFWPNFGRRVSLAGRLPMHSPLR